MRVLLLGESEVRELLFMREAIEGAFRLKGEGKVQMPLKSYVFFPGHGGTSG